MKKPRLAPGPAHPITVEPSRRRVRISFGDRVVAETDRALELCEASYPPVLYVPLDEVDPNVLVPSSHRTYCPYKGDASYYTLRDGDHEATDAVWSYRTPYEAVSAIAGHVACYPRYVTIEQLGEHPDARQSA